MHCSACGHENRGTAKFCEACGSVLTVNCAACDNTVRPGASFCDACGTPIGEALVRPEPATAIPSASSDCAPSGREPAAAERRQLTVMFCDIVGSTQLSHQLDPEALRDLVRSFQETSAQIIDNYGGHIAQYLGDGLLVYFGYPAAHEDDPARAIRAALSVIDSLSELNARLVEPVDVRIGIHTGRVVVGEMGGAGRYERLALGDTPNIASRVTARAEPNELLITGATLNLVRGQFEVGDLGAVQLRGLAAPLPLYRVVGEGTAQSRFEAAADGGLTALVGRDNELQVLLERWQEAKRGSGQVVVLSGEAGIGKSRLVREVQERIAADGATRIEFRCSASHQNSALYPEIQHMQRLLQFQRDDSAEAKLEKLGALLTRYRFPGSDTLAILAALLSLPHPPGCPPLDYPPSVLKRKTQEALLSWVVEEVERGPVCITWEDLHWADPSTLELLDLYLDQVPTSQIMILLSLRPESQVRLDGRSFMTRISLGRLGRQDVQRVVDELSGGRALPPEVLDQVLTKTDGVPLFVEELTKMVLESPLLEARADAYVLTGALPPLAIPATLHDSLMARLDQMSSIREVAQIGSTLGREFSYELISRVASFDDARLQEELADLVRAELFFQKGVPPNAQYVFKHALIQDAAYESMLISTRQRVHERVARVLEEYFPETVSGQPEVLAHHFTEAGNVPRAIAYWRRAGQRSVQTSANTEAVSHLSRALDLLDGVEDEAESVEIELDLQTSLGAALMVVRGYAAPEVQKAYARARELCGRMEDTPQLFSVLRGLWGFYIVRVDLETAYRLGEQCLELAERLDDSAFVMWSQFMLGMSLFHIGDHERARNFVQGGIELYDPDRGRRHRALQDPGVACLSYLALTSWFTGHPERALKASRDARGLAEQLDHPFSLAYATGLAAVLNAWCGDIEATAVLAAREIEICTAHDIPHWLAWGYQYQGWALAERGRPEEGIERMEASLRLYQQTDSEIARSHWMSHLAAAHAAAGRPEQALAMQDEALALAERLGEGYWQPEMHRQRGELILAGADGTASEVDALRAFERARTLAASQHARSLELRAVMSTSRVLAGQGRTEAAGAALGAVLSQFEEGHATADLQAAAALMERLRAM